MVDKETPDDGPKSERFNMFMSKSEIEAIDDWAWRNRIRSKSEAVRRLIAAGLALDQKHDRMIRQFKEAAASWNDIQRQIEDHLKTVEREAPSPEQSDQMISLMTDAFNRMEHQTWGLLDRTAETIEDALAKTHDPILKEPSFSAFHRLAEFVSKIVDLRRSK